MRRPASQAAACQAAELHGGWQAACEAGARSTRLAHELHVLGLLPALLLEVAEEAAQPGLQGGQVDVGAPYEQHLPILGGGVPLRQQVTLVPRLQGGWS